MRRWWLGLVMVALATLVALVASELVLRAAGISYPSFWRIDHDLGATLRPYAEGHWRREGDAMIRINSAGLRDREHDRVKPPHALRIAVLGDSYAEALQVPMDETFWAVMERSLRSCPRFKGRDPEVMNFGVSGYGTAQELLTLRLRAWAYQPDIVLLAFVTGNDVRNNSRELEPDNKRPFFVIGEDGLVADNSFRVSPWFRFKETAIGHLLHQIVDQSRLVQVVLELRRVLQATTPEERPPSGAALAGADGSERVVPWDGYAEAGLDTAVYAPPRDPAWDDAWHITEALLLAMRDDVAHHGAEFLVATLSNAPQVDPDPEPRRIFAERLGVPDLFYPDDRIRGDGLRDGYPVLTLAPAMRKYAEANHVYLHGFANSKLGTGHWNAEGHRVAGEMLADRLCAAPAR